MEVRHVLPSDLATGVDEIGPNRLSARVDSDGNGRSGVFFIDRVPQLRREVEEAECVRRFVRCWLSVFGRASVVEGALFGSGIVVVVAVVVGHVVRRWWWDWQWFWTSKSNLPMEMNN